MTINNPPVRARAFTVVLRCLTLGLWKPKPAGIDIKFGVGLGGVLNIPQMPLSVPSINPVGLKVQEIAVSPLSPMPTYRSLESIGAVVRSPEWDANWCVGHQPGRILKNIDNPTYAPHYEEAIRELKEQEGWAHPILVGIEGFRKDPARQHTFRACAQWLGTLLEEASCKGVRDRIERQEVRNKLAKEAELLWSVFNVRNPDLRTQYSRFLVDNVLFQANHTISSKFSNNRQLNLAGAILLYLFEGDTAKDEMAEKLKGLFASKHMKHGAPQIQVIRALLLLAQSDEFTLEEKRKAVAVVLEQKEKKETVTSFRLMAALMQIPEGRNKMRNLKHVSELKGKLVELIENGLDMDVDGLAEKFLEKIIEKWKDWTLILSYMAVFEDRERQHFASWLGSILEGHYPAIRYTEDRTHLDKVFAGGRGRQLEAEWRRGQKDESDEWIIEDTDDAEALLRLAVDVEKSCKKPDRENAYYLLPDLLDGKIRSLAIKDKKGNLIARTIFRILYDEQKEIPVLFMDKIYLAQGCDLIKAAEAIKRLKLFAKKRSKAMRLDLTWPYDPEKEGRKYSGEIVSLGGPVRHEYVDVFSEDEGFNHTSFYSISGERLAVASLAD